MTASSPSSKPWRSRLRRWGPPALLAALILGLSAWINLPAVDQVFGGSAQRVARLPALETFQAGQRVLILSPHPDDETLCCAGLIQQAQAAGARVFIAWATAGDGFEFDAALTQHTLRPGARNLRALGETRVLEARRAAAVLGIPAAQTFMLGYPDGGLLRLFTLHYATPYRAPRTAAAAVYVRGALSPGASYTGQALEADLRRVLNRVRPDLVLAPAPQDFHSDHRTVSYLALRLLAETRQESRLRFWVVHGGLEWPVPKGLHPELPLTVPPLASGLPWQRASLTPAQETRKLAAVNTYRTQTRVLGRFMQAFVRRNELLSPQALPPNAGHLSPGLEAGPRPGAAP